MKLYPYQRNDIEELQKLFRRGNQRILYQLPTGAGKTVVSGRIAQGLRRAGKRILILIHKDELLRQFHTTLGSVDLDSEIGCVWRWGPSKPEKPIQLAMIFSWFKRNPPFSPDYIIIDEAHHTKARTWSQTIERYPEAKILGLTATPIRRDGKALGDIYQAIHCGPSIGVLIADDYLSSVKTFRVSKNFRYSRHSIRMGEYSTNELRKGLTPLVIADTLKAYFDYGQGQKALMFGIDTQHSEETAARFNAAGVPAEHIDWKTPMEERMAIMQRFRNGSIRVLCNVAMIDEGVDVPDCNIVIDVSPTLSVSRYLQRVGRALRWREGKTAQYLDLSGNTYEHNLPDIDRIWSLDNMTTIDQRDLMRREGKTLRTCPKCQMVYKAAESACPNCGYALTRREIVEIETHLEEVSQTAQKKKNPQRSLVESLRKIKELVAAGRRVEAMSILARLQKDRGFPASWSDSMMGAIEREIRSHA